MSNVLITNVPNLEAIFCIGKVQGYSAEQKMLGRAK